MCSKKVQLPSTVMLCVQCGEYVKGKWATCCVKCGHDEVQVYTKLGDTNDETS